MQVKKIKKSLGYCELEVYEVEDNLQECFST